MLDFEKCKEVVEEVWKKKKVPQADLEAMGFDSSDEYWDIITSGLDDFPCHFMDREGIMGAVNSWEGFGRTVEAMEKRGFDFCIFSYYVDGGHKNYNCNFSLGVEMDHIKLAGSPTDATHLAALEAVRDADK